MWRKLAQNKTNQEEFKKEEANFMCEEAIIKDKERFGRVRSSLMEYLRAEFGREIANRALSRVNKRTQKGYFHN